MVEAGYDRALRTAELKQRIVQVFERIIFVLMRPKRLKLDINDAHVLDDFQELFKRCDFCPLELGVRADAEIVLQKLLIRHFADLALSIRHPVDIGIMAQNVYAVFRKADVVFYAVRSHGNGQTECRSGIFRCVSRGASVCLHIYFHKAASPLFLFSYYSFIHIHCQFGAE